MIYNIIAVPSFQKELKKLAKRYPSLKSEISVLFKTLKTNPKTGIALGNNCYKIRLSISSKGKGKNGGARIITNFVIADDLVYLLSIYDKSEKETLTNKEIAAILKSITE